MGAPPANTEIRAQGIRKAFGDHVVLDGVSLEIRTGDIVAIVGGSGSGKTVLLDILVGLLPFDAGHLHVADHGTAGAPLVDLATLDEDALARVRLHWAVVFQRNALFSGSVFDNVALWLREHTDLEEADIRTRVRASLEAVALNVDEVVGKSRDELSGGMAKRVAIARAIAVDPCAVFYDEPTTGLDPVIGGRIHELIWDMHHRKRADGTPRTTVIVTHDRELLRRMSPRVVMLHDRRVCFDGTYDDFGSEQGPPEPAEYLRAMPVLHARPAQW